MSACHPREPAKSDEQNPSRTPYHAPVLRVYGSLSRLTQGGPGSSFEGASGMSGKSR